jgi:hypothetical protein
MRQVCCAFSRRRSGPGTTKSVRRWGAGPCCAPRLRDAAVTAVWAALHSSPQQAQQARERAAQAVARTQNVSVAQAHTQVHLYKQQYRKTLDQAKQQAIEAADTGAKAVSRGALFGIIGLLLGAVAGWLGGHMGAVEPILTACVALDSLQSGPLGGSRTTTVVSAGSARSTTTSERVMPS